MFSRIVMILKGAVCVSLLVIGCTVFLQNEVALAGEQRKITVAVLSGGYEPAVASGIEQFRKETGVDVQVLSYGVGALYEKQLLELTAGSDRFDVISIDGAEWLVDFNRFVVPLKEYLARDPVDLSDFVPVMLEMSRFPSMYTRRPADYQFGSGDLYTLPVRIGTRILHYRKDLFEKNHIAVPKTLDDFLQAARKLTIRRDGKVEVYGTIMQSQGMWVSEAFLPVLWSSGGDVLDRELRHCALTRPESVGALEYFSTFYKEGLTPPESMAYDLDKAQTVMSQGLGAMIITYSPRALVFDNPKTSKVAGQMAWAPVPYKSGSGLKAGIGWISGWGLGISKFSKNKDVAWKFIKFLTGKDMQLKMAVEYANGPTRVSVFKNAAYQKVFPAASAVLEASITSRTRPGVPGSKQIEDIWTSEVGYVLAGQKSARDAMQAACDKIDPLLK